jgi:hypothetical protein
MSILGNLLLGQPSGFTPGPSRGLELEGTPTNYHEFGMPDPRQAQFEQQAYNNALMALRSPLSIQQALGAPSPSAMNPTSIPYGMGASNPPLVTNIPTPGGSTANLVGQLPELRGTAGGESRIDPSLRPYLELGLRRGEQLFFGEQQPQLYPGQMYVSPSQQTLDALAAQEQMARAGSQSLQQSREAFGEAMGGLSFTGMGGFLQGSPYRDLMIQAATRPLLQQFEQTTLPGIQSAFSRAGRYGSGAQERAIGQATEATGRAIGDISSQIAAADYARERGLQQQAFGQQIAASQVAPQIYSQQFLPSQQLAQIGAAQEQIAAQPLQEAMTRFQFAQQLPYQQLQGFLSGVYGTPMAQSQYASIPQTTVNRSAQNIGALTAIGSLIPESQRNRAIDYITRLIG